MKENKRERQQESLWSRVNGLLGGRYATENHKWLSHIPLRIFVLKSFLKETMSSSLAGLRSMSIFPSSSATSSQRPAGPLIKKDTFISRSKDHDFYQTTKYTPIMIWAHDPIDYRWDGLRECYKEPDWSCILAEHVTWCDITLNRIHTRHVKISPLTQRVLITQRPLFRTLKNFVV